ncbi:MAG: MFS transporter [Betaproteobacteria bacterium]|nr:MFS transporter [Betaproteobacteria bacterium]
MRRHRWTAFILVAAAFILSFFHRVAPAAIAGELQTAFQTTGATLGALAATYFYVYTVMQIPTGVLVDTLGPRRILTLGGVVAGVGSMMFGLADSFAMAAAGRTLVGFGVSFAFISLLKVNAAWFYEREFATLTGLSMFMGNLGSVLSAAPLAWLVTVTSWRNVFVAAGGLSLALALLTWWLVRDHPGAAGLPSMRELEGKAAHAPREGHWLANLGQVARNRLTWPGFWVFFGLGGTFLTFAGLWAVPYLIQVHGMDRNLATYHTSLLLIGFAVGSFAVGTLSDRLGHRKPLMLTLGAVYVLCWLPWLMAEPMPRVLSLALFGVMGVAAAGFTLTWACAKEVNPPALSGMATSLVNTGGFLGVAIYQPLVGWVLDASAGPGLRVYGKDDWRLGLGVLALLALAGFAAALFVRETHCRNICHD